MVDTRWGTWIAGSEYLLACAIRKKSVHGHAGGAPMLGFGSILLFVMRFALWEGARSLSTSHQDRLSGSYANALLATQGSQKKCESGLTSGLFRNWVSIRDRTFYFGTLLGAAMTRTSGQSKNWVCGVLIALLFHPACSARAPGTAHLNGVRQAAPDMLEQSKARNTLRPGQYVTEKGWGRLRIDRRHGDLVFSIETVLGESSCSLDGHLEGNLGMVKSEGSPSDCVIDFVQTGESIRVSSETTTECKYFCGYNAGFEGIYSTPGGGCGQDAIARSRKAFAQLYQENEYASAVEKLSPLLKNCLPTLEWEEAGAIRNELAMAQYKSGFRALCMETLAPYVEDAKKDDDSIMEGWSPAYADRYLSIITSARTSIALCSGTKGEN